MVWMWPGAAWPGGLRVALRRLDKGVPTGPWVCEGAVCDNGLFQHPVRMSEAITSGGYEAVFEVSGFDRASGGEALAPGFLERVSHHSHVADVAQRHHLPFKFTPWGFSLFRGGA